MEALHTPECRAYIQHLTTLMCRVVDFQSSTQCKEFVQDLTEFVWSGISLGASKEVCSAIAEVCANVVHALEMEDEVYQKLNKAQYNDSNPNERMRKRIERGEQWSKSYGNETLHNKANVPSISIETSVLSSLGDGHLSIPEIVSSEIRGGARVGESFEWNSTNEYEKSSTPLHHFTNDHELSKINICNDESSTNEFHDDTINPNIDVDHLRKEIYKRSDTLKACAEDLRQHIVTGCQKGKTPVVGSPDYSSDIENSPFLSQVDKYLTKKRQTAIDRLLQIEGKDSRNKRQHFFSKAAAAAGIDNEYGQQTLKAKLFSEALRNTARVGVGESTDRDSENYFTKFQKYRIIIYLWIAIGVLLFFLLWTLMAFYGLYAFFFHAPAIVKEIIYIYPNASTIELIQTGNGLIHEEL